MAIEQSILSGKPDFLDNLLKVKGLVLDYEFEECETYGNCTSRGIL